MDDLQLLREYAERRSDQAFTELVNRHIHFVYSTALRLVEERQLAEDVTQMVFIRLARKADSLRHGTVLTGWLYRTTQFVAQTVRRSNWRRRKRESLAMEFSELNHESESVWKEVAPLLEEAMGHLRQAEQDAVLLRFFAGKSLREVGAALGVSDDTAQKRVDRAVDKLRDYFTRRGVATSATLLTSTLAAHTVQAAPAVFASTLAASVTSGASAGLGLGTSLKLFHAMLMAKLKAYGLGAAVAAILIPGGAVTLLTMTAQNATPTATATPAVTNDLSNAAFVLRGRLQKPDGKPVAGALIRVATQGGMVRLYYITNAVPTNAQVSRTWTTSAADGTFAVGLSNVPLEGKAVIAVTHDDVGYAVATADELLANSNVVVLPWGRIEGVLRVGKSVGSNQMVNIGIWGTTENYEWWLVSHTFSVSTDAEGRFVFPRVAPTDVWLTRLVAVKPGDGRQSGHHYVKVRPGDRLQVTLGGTGCVVTGRLQPFTDTNLLFYGSMWARESHGMRTPRDWRQMSAEDKRLYIRAWRDSTEGELFKQEVRNYEFPVQPDGTFRVEDVRPGSYRMQVRATAKVPPGRPPRLAAKVEEIQVDVPEASELDGPLDVGTLEARPE
jgi:RNA polymerase sigma factor (sigma-70 family)